MKNGIGYITLSDNMVHFLMRREKNTSPLCFSAPASLDAEAVNALMEYAVANDVTFEHAVVAIDSRHSILKNYQLPLQSMKQIDGVIGFELEEDMPFEQDDVISDYFRGRYHQGESFVCAAALKKERISSLLPLFREEGIAVTALDLDVASFARACCQQFSEHERCVGLEIGHERTLFCCLSLGKVLKLAVIPWGESALAEALADAGAFSADAVERMMLFSDTNSDHGMDEEHEIFLKQVDVFLRKLMRETLRQLGDVPLPVHFVLSGNIVRMQGFRERFEEISQCGMDIWDELFLKLGEEVEAGQRGSGLATAYGTAEESGPAFDFLKEEFAPPRSASGWQQDIRFMAVFLLLVLFAWGGYAYASLLAQERELAVLEQSILRIYQDALPDVSENLVPLQYQSILSSRLEDMSGKTTDDLQRDGLPVIEVLNRISSALRDDVDVEFVHFSLDGSRIGFHGEVPAMGDVESIRKAIVEIGVFHEVKIRSAVADAQSRRVRFEMDVVR